MGRSGGTRDLAGCIEKPWIHSLSLRERGLPTIRGWEDRGFRRPSWTSSSRTGLSSAQALSWACSDGIRLPRGGCGGKRLRSACCWWSLLFSHRGSWCLCWCLLPYRPAWVGASLCLFPQALLASSCSWSPASPEPSQSAPLLPPHPAPGRAIWPVASASATPTPLWAPSRYHDKLFYWAGHSPYKMNSISVLLLLSCWIIWSHRISALCLGSLCARWFWGSLCRRESICILFLWRWRRFCSLRIWRGDSIIADCLALHWRVYFVHLKLEAFRIFLGGSGH